MDGTRRHAEVPDLSANKIQNYRRMPMQHLDTTEDNHLDNGNKAIQHEQPPDGKENPKQRPAEQEHKEEQVEIATTAKQIPSENSDEKFEQLDASSSSECNEKSVNGDIDEQVPTASYNKPCESEDPTENWETPTTHSFDSVPYESYKKEPEEHSADESDFGNCNDPDCLTHPDAFEKVRKNSRSRKKMQLRAASMGTRTRNDSQSQFSNNKGMSKSMISLHHSPRRFHHKVSRSPRKKRLENYSPSDSDYCDDSSSDDAKNRSSSKDNAYPKVNVSKRSATTAHLQKSFRTSAGEKGDHPKSDASGAKKAETNKQEKKIQDEQTCQATAEQTGSALNHDESEKTGVQGEYHKPQREKVSETFHSRTAGQDEVAEKISSIKCTPNGKVLSELLAIPVVDSNSLADTTNLETIEEEIPRYNDHTSPGEVVAICSPANKREMVGTPLREEVLTSQKGFQKTKSRKSKQRRVQTADKLSRSKMFLNDQTTTTTETSIGADTENAFNEDTANNASGIKNLAGTLPGADQHKSSTETSEEEQLSKTSLQDPLEGKDTETSASLRRDESLSQTIGPSNRQHTARRVAVTNSPYENMAEDSQAYTLTPNQTESALILRDTKPEKLKHQFQTHHSDQPRATHHSEIAGTPDTVLPLKDVKTTQSSRSSASVPTHQPKRAEYPGAAESSQEARTTFSTETALTPYQSETAEIPQSAEAASEAAESAEAVLAMPSPQRAETSQSSQRTAALPLYQPTPTTPSRAQQSSLILRPARQRGLRGPDILVPREVGPSRGYGTAYIVSTVDMKTRIITLGGHLDRVRGPHRPGIEIRRVDRLYTPEHLAEGEQQVIEDEHATMEQVIETYRAQHPLESLRPCLICRGHRSNCVLLNCRHCVVCYRCVGSVDYCPLCGDLASWHIRIY